MPVPFFVSLMVIESKRQSKNDRRPGRPVAAAVWLYVLPALFLASGLLAIAKAQTTSKAAASKKIPVPIHSASKSRTTSVKSFKKTSPARIKRSASHSRRPPVSTAKKQLHPTTQRYAEIQTALGKAGYFDGPTDGAWGPGSVEALTKFQQANGLDPTGKIDAQSLIKLDLGPKYETQAPLANSSPSVPK